MDPAIIGRVALPHGVSSLWEHPTQEGPQSASGASNEVYVRLLKRICNPSPPDIFMMLELGGNLTIRQ